MRSPCWDWIKCFAGICLLASCAPEPDEYRKLAEGSKWKLLSFGDQKQRLDSAELIFLNASAVNARGDLSLEILNSSFQKIDDPLWETLSKRYLGDSIEYISVHPNFLLPEKDGKDTLIYRIGVQRMRTKSQIEDARLIEFEKLDSLIRVDSIVNQYREYDGIWIRTLIPGDTSLVREGREVVIQYQGRTLDGKIFDDSRRQEGALRFVMGHEHQVIAGIETALSRMSRGETAEVIIPSWLAFGGKGSAGGLVPPYTPVVYRVEVIELAR